MPHTPSQCWPASACRHVPCCHNSCRTNKQFVRKVRAAADSTCEHKVLMPYSPHASRNRPTEAVSATPYRRGVRPHTWPSLLGGLQAGRLSAGLTPHHRRPLNSHPTTQPGTDMLRCVSPCLCVPHQLRNVIGKSYGVHPSTTAERYKGQSQVKLTDADPESRKPWKTTNGVSGLLCSSSRGPTKCGP